MWIQVCPIDDDDDDVCQCWCVYHACVCLYMSVYACIAYFLLCMAMNVCLHVHGYTDTAIYVWVLNV